MVAATATIRCKQKRTPLRHTSKPAKTHCIYDILPPSNSPSASLQSPAHSKPLPLPDARPTHRCWGRTAQPNTACTPSHQRQTRTVPRGTPYPTQTTDTCRCTRTLAQRCSCPSTPQTAGRLRCRRCRSDSSCTPPSLVSRTAPMDSYRYSERRSRHRCRTCQRRTGCTMWRCPCCTVPRGLTTR